ncbi:MAG: DUF6920 family protein [Pseudomonadota bacterium]
MPNTLLTAALSLAALFAALRLSGAWRWQAGTRRLRGRLKAARLPLNPAVVDFRELEGLPDPVQHFFRTVLKEGQPLVAGVRVRHRGRFNLGETTDNWKPFASEQQVVTRRPGFDWNGRVMMMPGLPVRVHDAYVVGEGILHAAVLGLFPVAHLRGGGQLAAGELMRFLAEAAWYPTALLPSQGVRWAAVDDHSARATLADGAVQVSLQFGFDAQGRIKTVRAEARGRMIGGRIVPTPWQGRFWDYAERGGMLVPLAGEVAWLTPEGAGPYWRGRITGIAYEFAQ